eukprot:scaffold539855_cov19-Prasinocladus_malaysianus.AAC.1
MHPGQILTDLVTRFLFCLERIPPYRHAQRSQLRPAEAALSVGNAIFVLLWSQLFDPITQLRICSNL